MGKYSGSCNAFLLFLFILGSFHSIPVVPLSMPKFATPRGQWDRYLSSRRPDLKSTCKVREGRGTLPLRLLSGMLSGRATSNPVPPYATRWTALPAESPCSSFATILPLHAPFHQWTNITPVLELYAKEFAPYLRRVPYLLRYVCSLMLCCGLVCNIETRRLLAAGELQSSQRTSRLQLPNSSLWHEMEVSYLLMPVD